ncbi:hypothetical protein C0992_008947, partial [Termitomyces sp. T32_za158]
CNYCAQKRHPCVFPAVKVCSRQGGATCEACSNRHSRCSFRLLWSAWLAAREEGWPLAGVYKALGSRRGVDEIVEEESGSESSEEDELDDEGGVEGRDVQGGGEEVQVVTEEVQGMGMGQTNRVWRVVTSGSEDGDKDEGESAVGPSVVTLGKRHTRDDSEDEDESGPSKWPWSDNGRGESGGGVEGRIVLHVPAPSLPPFSCVFSPLSGCLDEAASLCFQNARLEAANSMLQVEVELQAAQYHVALRRLVELQQERRAAQDDLLHAREVVGNMEDELARLWVREGHGSSAPRLVGLRGSAFQELPDAGVQ